jgi:hypothetical protein
MSREQNKKSTNMKRNANFLSISYKKYKFKTKNRKEIKQKNNPSSFVRFKIKLKDN